MLKLGDKTKFGEVVGVTTFAGGERYYFIITKGGRTVSLFPADVLEK